MFFFTFKKKPLTKKKKEMTAVFPPFFGPKAWDLLLAVASGFPLLPTDQQKTDMIQFITLMMQFLPCGSCSVTAKAYVLKFVPDVTSRDKLITYIVNFHNYVNVHLGKTTFTVTEARAAFAARYTKDLTEIPRSLEIVKENTGRITELQKQNENYAKQLASYDDYTNHSVYFYVTIGLSIALGIFLIVAIVLFIRDKIQIRNLKRENDILQKHQAVVS